MLELRPSCECCDKDLPPSATDAMICTFECTFCRDCVESRLGGVCPNCGGNFAPRPVRPAAKLTKCPPSTRRIFNPEGCGQRQPVDHQDILRAVEKSRGINPGIDAAKGFLGFLREGWNPEGPRRSRLGSRQPGRSSRRAMIGAVWSDRLTQTSARLVAV